MPEKAKVYTFHVSEYVYQGFGDVLDFDFSQHAFSLGKVGSYSIQHLFATFCKVGVGCSPPVLNLSKTAQNVLHSCYTTCLTKARR
jgi:hypothetical protein